MPPYRKHSELAILSIQITDFFHSANKKLEYAFLKGDNYFFLAEITPFHINTLSKTLWLKPL